MQILEPHSRPNPNMWTEGRGINNLRTLSVISGGSSAQQSLRAAVRDKCILCYVGGKRGISPHVCPEDIFLLQHVHVGSH